jgi:hypothetical protein
MLKRSEIKKKLVWNDPEDKPERYVLFENGDGSCIAVHANWENEFENGGEFQVVLWQHYAPKPEHKTRPMTPREAMTFIAYHEDFRRMVIRHYEMILHASCFDDKHSWQYGFIQPDGTVPEWFEFIKEVEA